MAICAAQKFFGVFSLKSPSMIQAEMAQGPVNPIKEVMSPTLKPMDMNAHSGIL